MTCCRCRAACDAFFSVTANSIELARAAELELGGVVAKVPACPACMAHFQRRCEELDAAAKQGVDPLDREASRAANLRLLGAVRAELLTFPS